MKNARLLSPHGVSDRNAPESAAIRRAEAIVKGDIRPALRNERRSREAFSMAFGPRGAVPGRSNTHATAVSPEGYAEEFIEGVSRVQLQGANFLEMPEDA